MRWGCETKGERVCQARALMRPSVIRALNGMPLPFARRGLRRIEGAVNQGTTSKALADCAKENLKS
jgi:hypothetical protein